MRISDWSSDVCSSDLLGVDTLEFNCEVRQPAVVFGIEAVRLAASGVADQNHIDIDATHSVDDRLARRTGSRPRKDVPPAEIAFPQIPDLSYGRDEPSLLALHTGLSVGTPAKKFLSVV